MGKECKEIVQRLSIPEEGKTAKVILNWKSILLPVETFFTNMFHSTEQKTDENFDQFVIRLKKMAKPCKFDNVGLHDEMIRNRLDLGCNDKAARARLFREKDCDLKKSYRNVTNKRIYL